MSRLATCPSCASSGALRSPPLASPARQQTRVTTISSTKKCDDALRPARQCICSGRTSSASFKTDPCRSKFIFLLLGVTLWLLLSPMPVFSLGVAPSSYSVDVDQVNGQQFKLRVINSDKVDIIVELEPTGALAPYVKLSQDTVSLRASEDSKTIYYTLELPSDLPAGASKVDIAVRELSSGAASGTTVSAKLQVSQRLVVNVPYPDSYLTGELFVNGNSINSPIVFTAQLLNRGEQFTSYSGHIQILGATNEVLGRITIPDGVIGGTDSARATGTYSGFTNPGSYKAQAYIYYGDELLSLEKVFSIGSMVVEATGIFVKDFELGDIAKLTIDIENKWNQKVDDVYADVTVYTADGRTLSTFRTSPVSLQAYQSGKLDAFWDTDGVPLGTYTVLVQLKYAGQSSDYLFNAAVGIDTITITSQQLGGQVIAQGSTKGDGGSNNSLLTLLVILLIVVVIINVVWLTVVQRLLKKKR